MSQSHDIEREREREREREMFTRLEIHRKPLNWIGIITQKSFKPIYS